MRKVSYQRALLTMKHQCLQVCVAFWLAALYGIIATKATTKVGTGGITCRAFNED